MRESPDGWHQIDAYCYFSVRDTIFRDYAVRIAVLEDEKNQLELIQSVVEALGYVCCAFKSGKDMLKAMKRDNFDLLILDWSVPDLSGFEILKWVRANVDAPVPILFITNRNEDSDITQALNAGADDYMVKPVRVPELMARLRALLRRAYPLGQQAVVEFGDYLFDMNAQILWVKGQSVELKHKEHELAYRLFSKMGELVSRTYLMDLIWGKQTDVNSRTLDTHISRLRTKLNLRPENGFRLSSVYSYGYRLELLAEKPYGAVPVAREDDGL